MKDAEHTLLTALCNARALEKQAEALFADCAPHLVGSPVLRVRLEARIDESAEQARLLGLCIGRLGGEAAGDVARAEQLARHALVISRLFSSDRRVGAIMAAFGFTQIEAANYRCLVAIADAVGDGEASRLGQQLAGQEDVFAAWLRKRLGDVAALAAEAPMAAAAVASGVASRQRPRSVVPLGQTTAASLPRVPVALAVTPLAAAKQRPERAAAGVAWPSAGAAVTH